MKRVDLELNTLSKCWKLLEKLSEHARARALLWMVRKHQNVGVEIDWRSLERQAFEPTRPADGS